MSVRVITMNGEVKYQGDVGPRGADGKQGKDLEFNWRGTELGVRQEGQTLYTYRDLKGEKGDKGEEYNDTEIRQELQNKVEKETGKGLSTNDYTTEEKEKLNKLPLNPLTEETDPTVPEHVKSITQEDINKWNNGGGNANILTFKEITVETTDWIEDTTYSEFAYKAEIPCEGVTEDFYSDVVFNVSEAISGNYAPISLSGDGIVTIYAVAQPESTIIIPSIVCSSKGA